MKSLLLPLTMLRAFNAVPEEEQPSVPDVVDEAIIAEAPKHIMVAQDYYTMKKENLEAENKAKEENLEKLAQRQEEIKELARKEQERVQAEKTRRDQELKEEEAKVLAESQDHVKVTSTSSSTVTDVSLLAQLVESEAKGESYIGKVAVAEVVLNRISSGRFPNSLSGVVYQQGQFQVVSNGAINNSPTQESIEASNQALNGSNYAQGALFFYNPRTATNRWLDSMRTVSVIGNHTFKNY